MTRSAVMVSSGWSSSSSSCSSTAFSMMKASPMVVASSTWWREAFSAGQSLSLAAVASSTTRQGLGLSAPPFARTTRSSVLLLAADLTLTLTLTANYVTYFLFEDPSSELDGWFFHLALLGELLVEFLGDLELLDHGLSFPRYGAAWRVIVFVLG